MHIFPIHCADIYTNILRKQTWYIKSLASYHKSGQWQLVLYHDSKHLMLISHKSLWWKEKNDSISGSEVHLLIYCESKKKCKAYSLNNEIPQRLTKKGIYNHLGCKMNKPFIFMCTFSAWENDWQTNHKCLDLSIFHTFPLKWTE